MIQAAPFEAWPRWLAALVLAAGAALILVATPPYHPTATVYPRTAQERGELLPGDSDYLLYRDVAVRVASGQNYWVAAALEHRRHHAPTAPPWVFREPVLSWIVADLGESGARVLEFAVVLLASALSWASLVRCGASVVERVAAVALQMTALGFALLPVSVYSHEFWAGGLIAGSLAAWRLGWLLPSVLLGVLACSIRELAAPYLIVMALAAAVGGHWREFAVWLSGVALAAAFLVFHLSQAVPLHLPIDAVSPGWLQHGGWRFAVLTAKTNVVLANLPDWLTAAVVVFGLLGFLSFGDAMMVRAAIIVAGYLIAFAWIGRSENTYWGLVFSSLLPIGAAFAPRALTLLVLRVVAMR